MFRYVVASVVVGCLVVNGAVSSAMAQVGEPQGAFNITVKQGATVIANHNVTIGPGGDLQDLKATFQDGDPEDFTQIGTIGPGHTPIILKVTSDGGALESMRILHWYVDVPVSLANIYAPGPTSLFTTFGGNIDVTITSLEFSNGVVATPQLVDNNTYLTSFMRDYQGHFYESVQANPYNLFGHGIYDIQVPGMRYLDSNTGLYVFSGTPGASCSWTWGNIVNPGTTTTVHNGTNGGQTPLIPGYVFELGTSVAFTAVPEPAVVALLAPLGLILARRRRR
jgi:hypothetical protein